MKPSKTKQAILGIVIALVLTFFIAYAVSSFYPAPQWDDFCEPLFSQPFDEPTKGEYEEQERCSQEYSEASSLYERNVFIFNLSLGLAVLLLAFFLKVEVVSSGLMGGGGLLMVYGTVRYWGELSNVLRTVFLGVTLIVLIGFGYKKFR